MREVELTEFQEDDFDALLRSSLADRPEPATRVDYAARAIMAAAPLPRPHRVSMWPSVLAAVAIVIVAVLGVLRVQDLASSWATDASSSESTSFETTTFLAFGAIGLGLSVVWLVCRSAFAQGEPEWTLSLG